MSRTIYTEASLYSNHKFDWDGPKPSCPLIGVGLSHLSRPSHASWIETPTVHDLEQGQELAPGHIWLLVFCSGYWWSDWTGSAHYGGCSWYVSLAFLKKENAEAYARAHESRERWEYYWVVPGLLEP